jgi:hypothetical protein
MTDDHYVPDIQNAHFDTVPFIEALLQKLSERDTTSSHQKTADSRASQRTDCYRFVYDEVDAIASTNIEEPNDDDLLCRYLSPEKFLWFISDKSVHLSRPNTFDDHADCSLHEDFELTIEQHLDNFLQRAYGRDDANPLDELQREWQAYERSRRNDWLISCWTRITEHYDDKLLSFKYAGGRLGVGITVRYGKLKKLLQEIAGFDRDGRLWSGYVNYDPRMVRVLPFNKRPGFNSEREVRFALRTRSLPSVSTPIRDLEACGLRLSDDSPPHHHAAVRQLWLQAGGSVDNIHET